MAGATALGLFRELRTQPVRNRPRTSRRGQVEHKPVATSLASARPPQPAHSPRATSCRNSRPPRRPAAQAASSFTPPLRRPGDRGLPPPFGQSAPRGARSRVYLPVSLTAPAPSGSTGTDATLSRLLPPSPVTPGSDCLQLYPAATTAEQWRSRTSIRNTSASWRTQDPSRFPVRARCRVGVRNASSPDRGRDLPCRALGKTDSGGGWLRVQLEQPGVLLLRRLAPGGPRAETSPCSDTLVWACSSDPIRAGPLPSSAR